MYRFLKLYVSVFKGVFFPIGHHLLNCRNSLSLSFCYYIDIHIDIHIDIIYNLLGIFLFFRKLHGLTQTQQKKKKKKSDTTDVKIVFHLCVFMSNFIS